MATKVSAAAQEAESQQTARKVTRKLVEPTPSKSSTLPHVDDVLSAMEANEATEQLTRAVYLKGLVDEYETELKDIRQSLTGICVGYGVPGVRTDDNQVMVNTQSRSSLNKSRLLEHVSAADLEACYDKGDDFYVAKIGPIPVKK